MNLKTSLGALMLLTLGVSSTAHADPVALDLSLRMGLPGPAQLLLGAPGTLQVETTVFGLPRNVGDGDRVFRGVVAATLIGLGAYGFASHNFSDAASGALMAVSVVPASTGAVGYCPLYHLLGIDTTFLDF